MDPATVALLIKGLDIAFTLAQYYLNREEAIEAKSVILDQMRQIADVRNQVKTGSLSEEQAGDLLDTLQNQALGDLRAAMGRL